MADLEPVENTNVDLPEKTAIDWSVPRDLMTAPAPPNTPGGHFPTYIVTLRPDGSPHVTGVGARWYDWRPLHPSGKGTRKSRNLAIEPICTIAMHLNDGLDLVLEGEATPVEDAALCVAIGALIRKSDWPVEVADGGFTAPFGPSIGGPPPWTLYRFVFHTAIGQGDSCATRWRFARQAD
jgi:hypothetical protein